MKNLHESNEYHKYESFNNNGEHKKRPSGIGWLIIGIVIFMLVSFIISGVGAEAIETLIALGFIAYILFK